MERWKEMGGWMNGWLKACVPPASLHTLDCGQMSVQIKIHEKKTDGHKNGFPKQVNVLLLVGGWVYR